MSVPTLKKKQNQYLFILKREQMHDIRISTCQFSGGVLRKSNGCNAICTNGEQSDEHMDNCDPIGKVRPAKRIQKRKKKIS